MTYSKDQQTAMLNTAYQSLKHGLGYNQPLIIDPRNYDDELQKIRACFVTLEINNLLRGCIGSLIAHEPLINSVANNAYNAGFSDHRFRPISDAELANIEIHISVLTDPQTLEVSSEQDLFNKLKVGIDGLILKDGPYQSTFLPSVWQSLKTPQEFVQQLKLKAGLRQEHWSDSMQFLIYQTQLIK